jgi:ribosomal protein L11 methylase PrmA
LKLPGMKTEWGDYYERNNNYTGESLAEKARITGGYLSEVKPGRVLDLGANDGPFSRIAAGQGAYVVSADIDPMAVEANWRRVQRDGEANLLPLLIDLTNPSPELGWSGRERQSFNERAKADAVLALALIHHLAIANNLPLPMVAEYFASLGPWLVIEFVPKEDSQVMKLLATREDIFPDYTVEGFEAAFAPYFTIKRKRKLEGTARIMYLMERS